VILPIFLIIVVLGSIFAGICTATEASAAGVVGSLLCAMIYRKFNWANIRKALYTTLELSGMVMWLVFAGMAFSSIYISSGASSL